MSVSPNVPGGARRRALTPVRAVRSTAVPSAWSCLEQRGVTLLLGQRPIGVGRADASGAEAPVEARRQRAEIAGVEPSADERRSGLAEERRWQLGARPGLGGTTGREQTGARGRRSRQRRTGAAPDRPHARAAATSSAPAALSAARSSSSRRGSCRGGGGNDRSVRPSTTTARKRRCRSALTSRTLTPRNPSAPWLPPSRSPALSALISARTVSRKRSYSTGPVSASSCASWSRWSSTLLWILDDVLDEPPERRKALGPGARASGCAARRPAKSSMNRRRLSASTTRSASHSGAPSRAGVIALARDQRSETRAPLIETLRDARTARRRLPARDGQRCRSARASPSGSQPSVRKASTSRRRNRGSIRSISARMRRPTGRSAIDGPSSR